MNQEKDQLFKEFEKEVWLFLDNDLPKQKMEFWNKKLIEIPELKKLINYYRSISNLYKDSEEIELSSEKFDKMIDSALSKNTFFAKIKNFIQTLLSGESELAFGKMAFASALVIAAIVISIVSNRNNPVVKMTQTINEELLDWDADFVDEQIGKVGNLLKVTKDDEYRKYYRYNQSTSSVEKNINNINDNIKALKKEINNKNL